MEVHIKRNFTKALLCLVFLTAGAAGARAESAPEARSADTLQAQVVASIDRTVPSLGTEAGADVFSPESASDMAEILYYDKLLSTGAYCPSSYDAEVSYSASNREDISCSNAFAQASGPEVPVVVNRNVKSFISYFQRSGRKHFERWLGRSQTYMALLRNTLREKGLPEDLSYIAFIESGLNPTAKSRAKAVGMWQFVRGTAQKYGLKVNWWIDERMDPEKATKAAARYFKDLYGQFGSWYLAAAGYNAGEGRVLRAMKKHRTEDFWTLASYRRPLKRETKEYVPKYLAAMLIAKDPKSYGFELNPGESLAYDKVRVQQATDLRVIAEAAGTTTEEIKRLNPELLRWFTPPDYPDYEVKIPAGTAQQFEENISKVPVQKRVVFLKHRVANRETLARISKKYKVPASEIAYLNNLGRTRRHGIRLRPGTVIFIPVRAGMKSNNTLADTVSILEYQS